MDIVQTNRRLAAILAADVVGYSRLMSEDEVGTLAALAEHRKSRFNPIVARYHGRVVKLIGDGTLVEFASVVDAVSCALEIQHPDDGGGRSASVPFAEMSEPKDEQPSIAVLPFDNMSGDAAQEYFSDGISEDVITDLSKVSGLLVIARNSSFAYKGRAIDLRVIGRELGVGAALEGSVRRAGHRVRINAQLIDTATGGHLWADRFDRNLTDIFAVQDEVTLEIVSALKVQLTPAEKTKIL